jgi:two-component sensor histidine kinase
MTPATSAACDGATRPDPWTALRIGHLYLDLRQRRLYPLNEAARQLYHDGIPALGPHPNVRHLHTPVGEAVSPNELPLEVAAREGRPAEAAFLLTRAGRTEVQLLWTATPLPGPGGRPVAVLATVCVGPPAPDWAALAGLAHDLRTPLHSLRLLLSPLGTGSVPEARRGEWIRLLRSAAERALQVSADLLEWCRTPVRGGRRVQYDWFALEPFLEDLAREHRGSAEEKGMTLTTDLGEVRGWEVSSDRVRLGRVLANLLSNAVRYTSTGGRVTLTVLSQGSGEDREWVLDVTDTGVGIAPEEQESIFQPFERGLAGREGESGGSGLGLAVVDRLVTELGMRREFTSAHGRGSSFRVLVPGRLIRRAPDEDTLQ